MKFNIPKPGAPTTAARIEVMTIAPPPPACVAEDNGRVCRSYHERSHVASDLVTAASPRWLAWAVSEALCFRMPRTQCFLSPVLTGGGAWDLGRGRHEMPMVFGGATCRPAWPDGQGCDDPDPATLPAHEALVPRRRVVVEDAGDVVFDDFESLGWPAIRGPRGSKA